MRSSKKPHPGMMTHSREGCHTMEIVLEEQNVCPPHQTSHSLGPTVEREDPKASGSEIQWGLLPEEPQSHREWKISS